MTKDQTAIEGLLRERRNDILRDWLDEVGAANPKAAASSKSEAAELLDALQRSVKAAPDLSRTDDATWDPVRSLLESLSKARAAQGYTVADTSHFVMAMKKPLFSGLQERLAGDPSTLVDAVWSASSLIDKLAQFTMVAYQRTREEIIARQQEELLELSTPVVKLWPGVLAAPMIGTLDSNRTQMVMEALLQRIVETGSELAIIDITGVPTVDTLVAQHLLKTVTAIRLMGADCIISGMRPQIAQTIVHLGINLQGIITKASLADALALALKKTGYTVTRTQA